MHVDGARLDINVTAPHRVQQLLARKHPSRAFQEMPQQAIFGWPQMQVAAATLDLMTGQVHFDIAIHQSLVVAWLRAAQHGAHAGHQFARTERLGDVIVGAGIQAAHPVAILTTRGQHDDGHVTGALIAADPPAHLDPRQRRQHPIQQDQVRRFLNNHQDRFFTVNRFGDSVALALKVVTKHGDQGRFVFDDQNMLVDIGHGSFSPLDLR